MSDLDDFFAKKDKKKVKAKPKFLTAEELVKNLEREAAIAATKPKKSETNAVVPSAAPVEGDDDKNKAPEQVAEEEWEEFEQERRKDYSGLKIGHLTINNEEKPSAVVEDDEDGDSETNTNVETNTSKRNGGGPWKKVIPAEEVTQIPMEIEKPSSKVYISPALRYSQASSGSMAAGPRPKARNRAAPDITNADYFPTLGAARPEEQRKKKNEPAFEEVRHGGRMQRIQQTAAAPVSVGNRFQSLDDDS